MAKAAMEQISAAEQYAQLKEDQFNAFLNASFSEESLKGVDLFEVKCPSGMVFKCRKPDMNYVRQSGNLPVSLSSQMVAETEGMTPEEIQKAGEEAFEKMTEPQRRAAIQVSAQMVRYAAVEPRIIEDEIDGQKNAITFDALTIADFNCLAKWASGGGAAEGLKTFRRKRR